MTQPRIDHFEAVRPDSIVPMTVDGVLCYAFTVRFGDVQPWDLAEGNSGSNQKPNERAEISYAPEPDSQKDRAPSDVREGMLQTYDVSYRFRAGWPVHDAGKHEWAVLTQFHPPGTHKAGVPNGFGGATVHGYAITFDDPMGSGSYFAALPIVTDTWISLRMAVKWSAGTDGYVVIQNLATGKLLGRYNGRTITAGEYKYIKQGYYRAGGLPEGCVYQTQIDIHDGDLTTPSVLPPAPLGASAKVLAAYKTLVAERAALDSDIAGFAARRDAIAAVLDQGPPP